MHYELFTATWCGPCRSLKKVLAALPPSVTETIKMVDLDTNADYANKMGIDGVPTMLKFDGDKVVDTMVGFAGEPKLRKFLNAPEK